VFGIYQVNPPFWNSAGRGRRSIDDPAFAAELERRAADGTKAIPWDDVKAQLRADLQS